MLFYNRLFSEQFSCWPKLDGLTFHSIVEEEANWLERHFEEPEMLELTKGMNSDKAPDPDGFTMSFIQACWDVIKDDAMKVFHDFQARSKFEKKP